jgi:hypothetical protein
MGVCAGTPEMRVRALRRPQPPVTMLSQRQLRSRQTPRELSQALFPQPALMPSARPGQEQGLEPEQEQRQTLPQRRLQRRPPVAKATTLPLWSLARPPVAPTALVLQQLEAKQSMPTLMQPGRLARWGQP